MKPAHEDLVMVRRIWNGVAWVPDLPPEPVSRLGPRWLGLPRCHSCAQVIWWWQVATHRRAVDPWHWSCYLAVMVYR